MSKIRTSSKKFALLAVAAIALAACGGSSENSSSASTAAGRTKNVALATATLAQSCALGGSCVVGDIGPGGGVIFFKQGETYMEHACLGWASNCNGSADTGRVYSAAVSAAAAYRGGGKSDWQLPTGEQFEILCKYARNARTAVSCYTNGQLAPGWGSQYWGGYSSVTEAYIMSLDIGLSAYVRKSLINLVRPIRIFTAVPSTTIPAPTTTTTPVSCAQLPTCVVGNIGPGGGTVFYVAPSNFTEVGALCGSTCRYLEAAPMGWIVAATPAGQTNCVELYNIYSVQWPGTATSDPRCSWTNALDRYDYGSQFAIGDGFNRTSTMVRINQTRGFAGTNARAYQGGGKADWFLPSKNELNEMYLKRNIIRGLTADCYWSSTEVNYQLAVVQIFSDGKQVSNGKSLPCGVRPVRAF